MAPAPSSKVDYPAWLNKSLFHDFVRKDYTSSKVIGFSVNIASGGGENYSSVLYRVNVRVENDKNGVELRSLMVKVGHSDGFGAEMSTLLNVFPKETMTYTMLIPAFEGYFAEIGENLKIAPKCVLADADPAPRIIMENVSAEGFKTADRLKGLDMEHIQLILEKLAKFHAASAVHVEKTGELDKMYETGMVNPGMGQRMTQMDGYVRMLKNFLCDLKCISTMNKVLDNYVEIMTEHMPRVVKRRDGDGLNVLCHGDLWSNNVLFKYEEDSGKPKECVFVDFQMSFYSSPVLDLHYMIVTSLNKETRLTKVDEILQFYHKHLSANLRKLKYSKKIPSLLDLQMDFLDLGLYGVFSALHVLPIVRAPPSQDSNMDNIVMSQSEDTMELKKKVYRNPIYLDALEDFIPHFNRKGYFDV